MTKLRSFLAGAVIAAFAFAAGAIAQQNLNNRTMSGNEAIVIAQGGPGGPSLFTTTAQMRNSQGVTTTSQTTGTLASLTTSIASLVSTTASVSLTVDLPPQPFDGEIFEWINGAAGAFTAGTVAQTDGSTIQGSTATGTLAAGASIEFRYVLATNTWYKLR